MVKSDRSYRPDEVAKMLGVNRSTVYRFIRDMDDPLPAYRLTSTGILRILGRDLNAWMERRRVHPEDE